MALGMTDRGSPFVGLTHVHSGFYECDANRFHRVERPETSGHIALDESGYCEAVSLASICRGLWRKTRSPSAKRAIEPPTRRRIPWSWCRPEPSWRERCAERRGSEPGEKRRSR